MQRGGPDRHPVLSSNPTSSARQQSPELEIIGSQKVQHPKRAKAASSSKSSQAQKIQQNPKLPQTPKASQASKLPQTPKASQARSALPITPSAPRRVSSTVAVQEKPASNGNPSFDTSMIDPRLLQLPSPASTPNETFAITPSSHNEGGMSVPMEQRIHGIPACLSKRNMQTPTSTPNRRSELSMSVPLEQRINGIPSVPAKRGPPTTPTAPAKKVKTEPMTPVSLNHTPAQAAPPDADPFTTTPHHDGHPADDAASWTPREYAALASEAYASFPFAAFAASYRKSRAAVAEAFHALVLLPLLDQTRPAGTAPLLGAPGPASPMVSPASASPYPTAAAAPRSGINVGQERVLTQRALQRECAANLAQEARWMARVVPDVKREAEDAVWERLVKDGVTSRAWVDAAKRERDGDDGDGKKKGGGKTGKKAATVRTVAEATDWVAEASEALVKARKAEERRVKNAKREEGGKGKGGKKDKMKDL